MNKRLQAILDLLQKSESLTPEEKKSLADAVKESDKEITITEFKLERTEKVKRTTAILLEETIAELEQKRKSVEAQNRELEIEAALERIRARAMAMHSSSELIEVANVLREQMRLLDTAELEASAVLIYHNDLESWDSWYAFRPTNDPEGRIKNGITTFSKDSCEFTREIVSMYKSPSTDYTLELRGAKREEWLEVLMKAAPEIAQNAISTETVTFDTTYFHFSDFQGGSLLTVSYSPPLEEIKTLQRRAASVFGLAFQRFLDLQKAEAQARESQIQLAMERVRARTMAMQRSEELTEAAAVIFHQIKELGIHQWGNSFQLWENDMKAVEAWTCTQGIEVKRFKIPTTEDPVMISIVNAAQKGEILHVEEIGGEALESHYKFMYSLPVFKEFIDNLAATGITPPKFQVMYAAYFSSGYILFITHELNPEAHDIFKRFAKVFEQTFTRFLDLQKAEAQARESHIQLAMERVRARTMAMQKSDELPDAANILFQQVQSLGMPAWSAGYCTWDEDKKAITLWMSSAGIIQQPFKVPATEDPAFIHFYEAWQRGESFYVEEMGGEELVSHYKYMCKLPVVGEMLNKFVDEGNSLPAFQIFHLAFFPQGFLLFITYEPVPEAHDIFKRFARVFEQTYTRFLDLQKAEAQARESQIQLAMERVRARTMAMQHSEELSEAASLLFKQIADLGTKQWSSGFNIWQSDGRSATINMCNPDGTLANPYHLPHTEQVFFQNIYEAKQKGEDFLVMETGGKELEDTYNYMFSLPEVKKVLGAMEDTGFQIPKFQVNHCALFSQGYLMFITYEPVPEMWDIFKRFAKVFEQTYTRFLDLQKAEAQAREAKIEASLERVRSRTMAMQHSNELSQTSALLFQQIQTLGVQPWSCGFNIWEQGDTVFTSYMGSPDGAVLEGFKIPLTEEAAFIHFQESRDRGDKLFIDVLEGETLDAHYRYFLSIPDLKKAIEKRAQAGYPLPTFQINHLANFSHGNLLFITYEPCPEAHDIFVRFAAVFEQTYIRFLDLQKAEAQTREGQIQLALERGRTQSMIMQHSVELDDTLRVFHEQVLLLNIKSAFSFLWLPDEERDRHIFWAVWAENNSSIFNSKAINYPLDINEPATAQCLVDWKGIEPVVSYHVPPTGIESYFAAWQELIAGVEQLKPEYFSEGLYYVEAFMKYGCFGVMVKNPLGEDEKRILVRFAVEFERAYTRFLDLQKAEAQAREAQIEAALERVRSRTMAMQRSEELLDVASILFQQVKALGVPQWNCGFNIWNIGDTEFTYYPGSPDGIISPSPCKIPLTEHPVFKRFDESRRNGDDLFIYEKQGEEQKDHYRYMLSLPGVGDLLRSMIDSGFQLPTFQIDHLANFSYGNLIFITYEHFPEMHDVFKRFAKVFEQTYTRFLDLQKAEAQTREAQIEAALEKVRSRSLAMHKSEEVAFVIDELLLRMKDLEIGFDAVNILEFTDDSFQIWAAYQPGKFTVTKIPFSKSDIPYVRSAVQAKNNGHQLFTHQYQFEEKNQFLKYLFEETNFKDLPDVRKQFLLQCPCYTVSIAFAKNTAIQLQSYTRAAFSESENNLLRRFANVFEQAYTRFLDLKKAEEQGREATIEAALERVRSRTMAMQRSDELADVAQILFKQVEILGIHAWSTGFNIWQEGNDAYIDWVTNPTGGFMEPYSVDLTSHSFFRDVSDAKKRGEDFQVFEISGEPLKEAYALLVSFAPKQFEEILTSGIQFPSRMINHYVFGAQVSLMFVTPEPCPQAHDIFKRFGNVFEQTYTRFLDLKKAEAQAREAQIEASLERVRSKTMAMHNSHDVGDTVATLFDELTKLGVRTNRCGILIFSNSNDTEVWTAKSNPSGEVNLIIGHLDVAMHPMLSGARNSWKNKNASFSYEFSGDDLMKYYQAINNHPEYPIRFDMDTLPSKEFHSDFYFPEGAVFAFTSEPITADDVQIFKRLAGVFGQTYRRYLDLQKAEAQARESQIEAALERVRSRTMAMHRSEEIADIVGKILKELTLLDVALNRVLIWIFNPEEKYISWWSANPEAESNAESYRVDYNDHPVFLAYFKAWQKRQPLLLYTLGGNLKESWEDHLFQNTELSRLPRAVQDGMRSEKNIFTTSAIGDYGLLMAGCFEPFSDEINDIIQRFGRVFQQSYTRYVDVQKAEAQAREATIEASLEKVRGKAMAMHNSNDLIATASLVFTELRGLGIKSFRSGVGLTTKDNRKVKLYSATSSDEGDGLSVVGWAVLDDHPVLSKTYDCWIRNEDYFPVLKGEELKSYYEKIIATFSVPLAQSENFEQYGYFLPFSEGLFYGWSEKPFTEEEVKILHRFKAIVDLTFRRYIELQKSEANAVEAVRQASLDRVRAEIASMRTTNDLDRITPLIWKELNILNIPFVRCGVFIMDETQQQIHTFLSTPDGKAIAAFHLPFSTPGNVGEILSHWMKKQMYISHWNKTAFSELGELLVRQGSIPTIAVYMSTIPQEGIHLHCLPFMQGMFYVGNTSELKEDDIQLIHSVADAFSTAYARYEDFNKLESANTKIEKTLMDLKQTQAQLVQSEKMASLGELTAGIAHEIQNPLNFVNNFSEINAELLTEMDEEIEKGNFADAKDIIKNVIKNEEKIRHHGKRADAIVKGMLQHSRSSSGIKEPTDINALTEEYLRLAYHGLRAKDKSFNVKTNTNFDESIGIVKVVPQDIGRVVLNLITNAFYAVSDKKNHSTAQYEPTVSLTTKKYDNSVSISVKDNGNGIPQNVLDKIFQPFFTTKPAGQGTGLGLSLSYDIVKAHGGELKVDTTVGVGSEFTVSIMM